LTYQDAKQYLSELSKSGTKLGLENIQNLLVELENPQDALRFVHLAGTNGKGSVLTYLASILKEANYKTGQYTSPSLISKREQLQINGEWITKEDFTKLVIKMKEAIKSLEAKGKDIPTVFEVETAMAFLYFKEQKCDIVVLETGMGGIDDATNIVKNTLVAGFTSISLDHMSFLGETIEEISQVKAGIIKEDSIVVSGIQDSRVLPIIKETAWKFNAPFKEVSQKDIVIKEESYNEQVFTYKSNEPLTITMGGYHQVENAALALEIIIELQKLGFSISQADIEQGLKKAIIFGRFSTILEKPIFILDGAHNANGVTRLRDNINRLFPNQKITFILGVFKDKEVNKIVRTVLPVAKKIYTVSLPNQERTLSADELKQHCHFEKDQLILGETQSKEESPINILDLEITSCTSIDEGVKLALATAEDEDVVIAFGSLSYLSILTDSVLKI
jgi:dihydrofolate synthase/folylpolyglutamate synthase